MNDVELPNGWARVTLRDVLHTIEAGKSFTCEPRPAGPEEWGIIKVSAMTWGQFDESENKAVPIGRAVDPAHEIHPGDVLISRANTREYVGAPVLVGRCRSRLLLSDKSLRLVPTHRVSKKWLTYLLSSPKVRQFISKTATGTKDSMRNISQHALLGISFMLPPLAEQHRIVEALEGHLSRLDAAEQELETARKKIASFRKSILLSLVPESAPTSWEISTVGDAGTVGLGRQRHPDWHSGPEMHPYLRVANVFEDRIDTSDVMEMDFSGVFDRYRLEPGDVLLNEGQSPHLVGRPALYRGTPPNVAFTNSLLRFQARPDVLPEWALLVFRRHLHARRFMREVRITTNIAHLSVKRLKPVEFPIPSLEEQKRRVQSCDELMSYADAMEQALKRNRVRAKHLRSAVLERAFTGRLIPQDPADEPVFLDRILAERVAQGNKPKRATRRSRKAGTSHAPPPPALSTSPPTTAVQQELPL
ncbi:restriction endonuclease subunit S [Streptomyces sp. MS2.AVA.5]|uniref:Restriction endonuclease subunit S n=1 Tax=Streptomyces achmelvichensis TaxID=3134111 RepID=A0ACC6PZ03_9ACTN